MSLFLNASFHACDYVIGPVVALALGLGLSSLSALSLLPLLSRRQGCGLHKPNQQTLVPLEATAALLAPLDLSRLRGEWTRHVSLSCILV